jgi:hypothetical protein
LARVGSIDKHHFTAHTGRALMLASHTRTVRPSATKTFRQMRSVRSEATHKPL